jgi:alpha 1,6-mannosyltransferase
VSLKDHVEESTTSWKDKNPSYFHLLWNDTDIDLFVRHFYPGQYQRFSRLPKPVLKADLFRYMVLNSIGGVYADVDTICLRDVDNWIQPDKELQPWEYKGMKIDPPKEGFGFIIGVEADVPKDMGTKWKGIYYTPMQMCQWTMGGSPGHPALAKTIYSIFKTIGDKSRKELENMDVIQLTGPAPWTSSIFWSWKAFGVQWEDLREFGDRSRVIGDQLVLPITSFSPGLGQVLITMFGNMGSKRIEDPDALVRHLWAGSWRG